MKDLILACCLLLTSLTYANNFASKDFQVVDGYEIPENFNWLKHINNNESLASEARQKLENIPTPNEVARMKSTLFAPETLYSSKIILGSDNKKVQKTGLFNNRCTIVDHQLNGTNSSLNKNWHVNIRVYTGRRFSSSSQDQRRTLLLIPPTGGTSVIDKFYATYFCKKWPIRVAVLTGWENDKNDQRSDDLEEELKKFKLDEIDPRIHDISALNSMAAIKLMIEFLDTDQPLTIMGNSVGGIISTLALGVIDQIDSGITVVSGADLNGIISRSGERKLTVARGIRSALWGDHNGPISVDDYERRMQEFIHIKASDYFHHIKRRNKSLYKVIGRKDITVPTYYQIKKYDQLKDHITKKFEYNQGHVATILKAASKRKSMAEFILSRP